MLTRLRRLACSLAILGLITVGCEAGSSEDGATRRDKAGDPAGGLLLEDEGACETSFDCDPGEACDEGQCVALSCERGMTP